jgi:hypothetical protein
MVFACPTVDTRIMSEPAAEVLEAAPSRAGRRWSRRAVVVTLTVVAMLAGTAYVVDHRVRAGEGRALASCGERAAATLRTVYQPLRERWGRALPALDGGAALMIRFSLYRQLSEAAVGASEVAAGARRDCAAVEVWPVHADLVARRDDCVTALTRHEEFLAAVARSGVAVNSAWPEPLEGC